MPACFAHHKVPEEISEELKIMMLDINNSHECIL